MCVSSQDFLSCRSEHSPGSPYQQPYLIWTALFYAGVGTWLTVNIGRPLVPLNVDRQPRSSWPAANKADDDGQTGAALGE
jgi:hypothetical protein